MKVLKEGGGRWAVGCYGLSYQPCQGIDDPRAIAKSACCHARRSRRPAGLSSPNRHT